MNTKDRAKGSFLASEIGKDLPHAAPATSVQVLLDIMASLRAPDGCPWDQAQSFESLLPYLQEESAEYLDAVRQNDVDGMREELGDVLLQVAFHAEIAREKGLFDFQDVVDGIAEKLWTRHPHVFGDREKLYDPSAVEAVWNERKRAERAAKGIVEEGETNPLSKVSRSLDPLVRSHELGRRAAKVGFDWTSAADVVPKIREELSELEDAMSGGDADAIAEELGDLLFSVVNIARKLGVRPDAAIARANHKFERRFAYVVKAMDAEKIPLTPEQVTAMERFWNEARSKRIERD